MVPPTSITLYSQKWMFYYAAIWNVKHGSFCNVHGVILGSRENSKDSYWHLNHGVECKLKNTFCTGMCKFGLGGAFYRRSLTLVCVFMFKCDCQDLCNDVVNGVAREMQRLLAIAAALCAVTVPSHRQKGWGQHAQITLRRAESFFNP